MKKKCYEIPEIEIVSLDVEDIITASYNSDNDNIGETPDAWGPRKEN